MLERGLTEGQANQVVVALHEAGIGATKEPATERGEEPAFQVLVPRGEVADALAVLRAAELPRRREPGLGEMFGEASLVPTATEERARYVAALGGELARSLESIDGVLDARVHVAIPDTRELALEDEPPRPRASVLLKHRSGRPPYDEDAVRSLVAGAVDGMHSEDVAVVGVPGSTQAKRKGPALVTIGPVTVTRGSAPALKAVLGASLGLHVLLATCLVLVLIRRGRLGRPVPEELDSRH